MGVKSIADKYLAEVWLRDPKKYYAGSGNIKDWKVKCRHF